MQPKLWREPRAKRQPRERLSDRFDRQNLMAARIILANPQRYAGLPYEWAIAVSKKKAAASQTEAAASTV